MNGPLRDTVRGAGEAVRGGGAGRAVEADLEGDRVRAGMPPEGFCHKVTFSVIQ